MAQTFVKTARRLSNPAQLLQRQQLQTRLAQTKDELDAAFANFNGCLESDLIDMYLFEINALQAQYGSVLRQMKQLEV